MNLFTDLDLEQDQPVGSTSLSIVFFFECAVVNAFQILEIFYLNFSTLGSNFHSFFLRSLGLSAKYNIL